MVIMNKPNYKLIMTTLLIPSSDTFSLPDTINVKERISSLLVSIFIHASGRTTEQHTWQLMDCNDKESLTNIERQSGGTFYTDNICQVI